MKLIIFLCFQILERIELSYNLLGDGCASTLATIVSKLPQLTHIGLSSCDITKNFFQQHRIALSDALQGKYIIRNKDQYRIIVQWYHYVKWLNF